MTVNGIVGENTTQAFNLGSHDNFPYLLSAQILLSNNVWSDLQMMEDIIRIDNNKVQVNLIKATASKYAGFQVRFVFLCL